MTLKHVSEMRPTDGAANDLQHQMAERIRARQDMQERRERHYRRRAQIRRLFSLSMLLSVLGALVYATRIYFPEWYGDASAATPPAAASGQGAPARAAPAPKPQPPPEVHIDTARQNEQLDAYMARVRRFSAAPLDYWKNAPAEDRPGAGRGPLTFEALVPQAKGDYTILEIKADGKGGMTYAQIRATGRPIPLRAGEFSQLTARSSYLILVHGHAYFCTPRDPERAKAIRARVKTPSGRPDAAKVWSELGLTRP